MVILNDLSLKNIAKTAIGFFSALIAFLSFSVFHLITGEWIRGFTAANWLSDAVMLGAWERNGFATFLLIPALLCALAAIGLFGATFFIAPNKSTYSKGMRLVSVLGALTTLILMIAGFMIAGHYWVPDCTTGMIIPFIVSVILVGGHFGADMFL